ncbi:putative membrane protein [Phytophthora megakarya]|uniref:Putative membrane protein n=1 Tax=Phytophthora megakarya TaxID=4795 RepID=A0A225WLA3_9STRA|nr:putative membrane protein [Phytophthora megakarya]
MDIQLNAAPEDEEVPPGVSHAVPMSSLLSDDVGTPREAPAPARSGLSSLMNSPLAEDEVVLSASQESAPNEGEDVEMEQVLPQLQTSELITLQTELHTALNKLWTDSAPAPKRQKKGKQTRRKAAVNNAAQELEIHRIMDQLQHIVNIQFSKKYVLVDVVKICTSVLELSDEKESVQSFLVIDNGKVDFDKTVGKLPSKPLYGQLVGVIRRAVLSGGEVVGTELLTQVLEWCLTRPTPENWTWVLVAIAQMNSYSVQEFLFREALARYHRTEDVKHFLPVLEFLAAKYPAQMVDILRDVLEECSNDEGSIHQGNSIVETVSRLVALAGDSAVLVTVCDDNLQWIVTDELVKTLASKIGNGESNGSVNAIQGGEGMEAQLLTFLNKRSAELSNSGFQLLLLLQNLSTSELSPPLAASVGSFQKKVLEFAGAESSCAFAKGVYCFLPYICQSSLRLLQTMTPVEEASDINMIDADEKMTKDTARQRFNEWKAWLCLLAQSISRTEVTEQLIKAELMLAEFNELPLTLPFTAIQPADRALCDLLSSLLTPSSPEYVAFVRNIVHECHSAAPRARRRILGIIQTLLNLNDTKDMNTANDELHVTLFATENGSCMEQLARAKSWNESLDSFKLWKGVRGVEFWESFLDLARSKDALVASRALSLASRTPFLSLEDPAWQYRCTRKLSSVFFSLLRQYRVDLVSHGDKLSSELSLSKDNALQSRLQTVKMILFRVLALNGGVAHYPSSVYSMFASLWLDALLSTASATSIPTHFPNDVNFADMETDNVDERQIIRCERTISSKCTNLQSSQVITKVPEAKLVYRKTLDSSWEREMHAARVCSVYATDIFSQLLTSTGTASSLLADAQAQAKTVPNTDEDEQLERQLKVIVNMLLDRVVPCCGIPNDDIYKDMLPNRSSFDVDLRVEQWLNHFPAFLPLLRTVISTSTTIGSSQLLRLVPVLKSALIVLLGHWNSVKGELSVENVDVPPYMRNQNQLTLTCELIRLLRATNWLPLQLAKTAELLPMTTPADIRSILFSCWFYLSDHPPRSGSRAPTPATSATTSPISSGSSPAGFSISGLSTGGPTSSSSHPPLEFYLIPLRKALHRNIHKIGAKYPLFMC